MSAGSGINGLIGVGVIGGILIVIGFVLVELFGNGGFLCGGLVILVVS